MSFKDISYLELWQPFFSAERNHLCNFGRGHYEEQFCEIILNLGKWFRRRCRLKKKLTGGRTTDEDRSHKHYSEHYSGLLAHGKLLAHWILDMNRTGTI